MTEYLPMYHARKHKIIFFFTYIDVKFSYKELWTVHYKQEINFYWDLILQKHICILIYTEENIIIAFNDLFALIRLFYFYFKAVTVLSVRTLTYGQNGISHTIITDNAGGYVMQKGMVDVVIVGSDRTTLAGDVCNKIGTYKTALAAKDNNIPFYAALPVTSFDFKNEKYSETSFNIVLNNVSYTL